MVVRSPLRSVGKSIPMSVGVGAADAAKKQLQNLFSLLIWRRKLGVGEVVKRKIWKGADSYVQITKVVPTKVGLAAFNLELSLFGGLIRVYRICSMEKHGEFILGGVASTHSDVCGADG